MVVLPNAFKRLRRFRHFYFSACESKLSPLQNKNASQTSFERHCARDWIRTSTWFPTLRPEHSASTNFATRAVLKSIPKVLFNSGIHSLLPVKRVYHGLISGVQI